MAWIFTAICLELRFTPPVLAENSPVRDQLKALADQEGFVIKGIESVATDEASVTKGDAMSRIRELLGGYNYLIVEARPGKIEKVLISAPSESESPAAKTIQTSADPQPVAKESKHQPAKPIPGNADRPPPPRRSHSQSPLMP